MTEETIEKKNQIFISRQPLLNRKNEIFGYELYSKNLQEKAVNSNKFGTEPQLLFNIISHYNLEALLGGKIAFLACELDDLNVEFFDNISPKSIVLEIIHPNVVNEENIKLIKDKIIYLKSKGFQISFDQFVLDKKFESWLKEATYVKIQSTNLNKSDLNLIINKIKSLNIKVVAEHVDTLEKFSFLKQLDFELFQGYFFCEPKNLMAKISGSSGTNILKLIDLTLKEADLNEIEKLLKTDPDLSFKLLRYINSAGMSNGREISSFNHAIQMLGYKKLFKWLSVLLSMNQSDNLSKSLSKVALSRAKFMELLSEKYLDKSDIDSSFVVGLFSLLEAMLNVPMKVILKSVDLPESMVQALLFREGKFAILLDLAISLEKNDWIGILAASKITNFTDDFINEKYLEALEWANQIK